MYILVQWLAKPHDITIMKESESARAINEGEIVKIEYPNKGIFKATLLHRSGEKL